MKIQANNDELEIDYYTKILDFFKNRPPNKDAVEIWKSKSFIRLMKVLERHKNKELVQNAIIIIISLFEQLPPDLYNNRGINVNLIKKKDKNYFLSVLKSEFIDEIPN